jgi:hypothetical protein
MRLSIAAAFALAAAPSPLHAQAAAAPAPSPAVDIAYATPLAGTWSYAAATDGSEATFRSASALPQLTIRCARARRVVTIAKPAGTAAPFLLVWTSSQARSYPASFDAAAGRVSVQVTAFDSLLDAIAFSRGRFGVSVTGSPVLVLPAWPEVARVIDDCRG